MGNWLQNKSRLSEGESKEAGFVKGLCCRSLNLSTQIFASKPNWRPKFYP
jgi:hypothetical protein